MTYVEKLEVAIIIMNDKTDKLKRALGEIRLKLNIDIYSHFPDDIDEIKNDILIIIHKAMKEE